MKRRLLSMFMVFCICFSCLYSVEVSATEEYSAEIMRARGGASAIVSMSFDDGHYDTACFLNEQFAQKKLKGSLALITDRLDNDAYAGTLEQWQALFAQGNLEPISHSASHLNFAPDDGSYPQYEKNNTAENYQTEIVGSKQAIENYFGTAPLTFCPAGGHMSSDGYSVVQQNYYAARLTKSIGNVVQGSTVSMQSLDPQCGTEIGQWYNLKDLSVYLSGSADRAELLCDYVDMAIAQKGWFITYCHGIVETGDKASTNNMSAEDAEIFFSYLAEKQNAGEVWCVGLDEATKYIRERQASTVTVTGNDSSRTVNLTMADTTEDGLPLDTEIFHVPLTIKAEVPANWETVNFVQNGEVATVTAFTDRTKRYVYIDVVPNGGEAVLTMASERENVNDHQALDASLAQYWQAESVFEESDYAYASLDTYGVLQDDDYAKLPLLIDTYYSEQAIAAGFPDGKPPVILYVINTNTERIGTDSDVDIVGDLIDAGYIVLVCDYQNDPRAVSPDLDWSLQMVRTLALEGKFMNGQSYTALEQMYILPAGYRLSRNVQYFNYAENGTTGVIQQIIDIWNDDINGDGTHTAFKKKFGKKTVTYSDGTTKTVNEIVADSIDDCVKMDGTPLDLNLYMDIIYPSNPANKVPVMMLSSSSQARMGVWTSPLRPHLTGFLFSGYAGVVFDHAHVPMARDDHYGYFEGTPTNAFSLNPFTGVKSITAASRRLRYLADTEPETYRFDTQHFGVYGHSKGAFGALLANPNPEEEYEMYRFAGYTEEMAAADAARQPWTTYPSSGEKIPSNVQMAYYSSGSGVELFAKEGQAPTYTSTGEDDTPYTGVYQQAVNTLRDYDVPAMHFSMPGVGHTLIYGKSDIYGIDMYESLFDFANYWLKDDPATVEYILPKNGTEEVDVRDEISVKFSGPVSREEIAKVSVINDSRGERISGTWRSEFGDTLWIFTPTSLYGGESHTIIVPQSVAAKNGKTIQEKRATFKTKYETTVKATAVASDNAMTLTKTADTDSGVYFVFDGADCKNSVKTALRFTVTNDAAQHIQIYALDQIDGADVTQSTVGEWLGEVKLAGKGTYEADITAYMNAHPDQETYGFVLKAEKEVGETVLVDTDFDNRKDVGFTSSSKQYVLDGNACYKSDTSSTVFRLAFFGYDDVTEEDFGRRFKVSLDVYSEVDRVVSVFVGPYQPNVTYSDLNGNTQKYAKAAANTWNTFTMDFVVDNPMYYTENYNKRALTIQREGTTYDHLENVRENLYFDNIKVTEVVTDAIVAAEASENAFAPSLVLHNADITTNEASGIDYIRNGEYAASSFAGGFISGGAGGQTTGAYKKVYAKVDLAEFDAAAAQTVVKLHVTNQAAGTIDIYGLPEDAAGLDLDTIHYLNAPANDRFGSGVLEDSIYGNAPIATVSVTGAGEYTADITAYLQAMEQKGANAAGLVFVSDTQDEIQFTLQEETEVTAPPRYTKTFSYDDFTEIRLKNDAVSEVNDKYDFGGNAISVISIDETVNHGSGSGKSIKVAPTSNERNIKFFNLFDHELTEEDLGRTFNVDVYVKVDPGTATSSCAFYMGLMSWNSDSAYNTQQYGSEGTGEILKCVVSASDTDWIKYTYPITVEEYMLSDSNRGNNPLLFSIRFYTRCKDRIFWIDDLTITETTPTDGASVNVIGAKGTVISNQKLPAAAPLAVSASDAEDGIYKTYLSFAGADYENISLATLNMQIKNDQPHTVSVYAIPDYHYQGNLTFNNAPANTNGTAMDLSGVYGGAPVATLNLNGTGTHRVDVTDYIKDQTDSDYVFALATDEAVGRQYLKLDFETYSFTEHVDYQNYGGFAGSVDTSSGACVVSGFSESGEGIRLLNAFGNGVPCESGVTYRLTAEVTAVGDADTYQLTVGAAADGAAPAQSDTYSLKADEKTTITFIFDADSDTDLSNLIFADSSEAPADSFVIDNLTLDSEITEVQSASLEIATATEPELPDYHAGSFVFLSDGVETGKLDRTVDTVKVDVYNKRLANFAPKLIVALYEGDTLKKVYFNQTTVVPQEGTATLTCQGIDLSDTSADTVKLMLWKDFVTMAPLKGYTEVSLL